MLVVVAVVAAALGVAARQSGVTRGLEQSSIDARFQIRGRTPPPPGFVLVAIDATTFNNFRDAGMSPNSRFRAAITHGSSITCTRRALA